MTFPGSLGSTTVPGAPSSTLPSALLALYFVYPRELEGYVVPLCDGLEVGRMPREDLPAERQAVLRHPTVSRRHATIHFGFGQWIVKDAGSANKTRVDGVELGEPGTLGTQTVVRFGDTLAVVDTRVHGSETLAASPWGQSPAIVRVLEVLRQAAPEPAPVLIQGETGTGKEFLAADVHRLSGRRGAYVKLSCAELAPQLIESQLFGHERGAFTGAHTAHPGLFVAADGGTLFLDEIGELPLELQAKLLRVVQEGEVRSVGSVQTKKVDVRLVCATNRNLAVEVEAGRFRRDLHARLSFFELDLPPLRERRQDLLGWVDRLCQRWGEERGRPAVIKLQPSAAERLLLHGWSDNLRGLDRFVHRVLAMDSEANIGLRTLSQAVPELQPDAAPTAGSPSVAPQLANQEPALRDSPAQAPAAPGTPAQAPSRDEFLAVYESTGRSVRATSKHFGRDRRQIYRWLEYYGIKR